jgi:hypothetical protein
VPYSFETARMHGRTAATGRMLLPSHTCLRTSIIVGTNRRGGSLGCDIRGGEFRILDWMGSGSGPLPRRHCGKGQRRFRSAVHRSYSYFAMSRPIVMTVCVTGFSESREPIDGKSNPRQRVATIDVVVD